MKKIFVTKEFDFAAAHQLTKYHGKCERMHGHNYRLSVTVAGEVAQNGLLIDFLILKNIVNKEVLSQLDHRNLNDLFDNPTAEVVANWIWERLVDMDSLLSAEKDDPNFPEEIRRLFNDDGRPEKDLCLGVSLYEVKLWETSDSSVTINA